MTTIAEQFIEQGRQLGLELGRQLGIEKGARIRINEIAKKMLSQHLSTAVISQVTGLTDKEIQALQLKSLKDQIDNED
jgi:predicted transposase/invertase (TIGR01784 family)